MKIKVIEENCIGCGACEAISDKLFKVDGVSVVKCEEVPEELKEKAQEAIDSCPTSAIEEVSADLKKAA